MQRFTRQALGLRSAVKHCRPIAHSALSLSQEQAANDDAAVEAKSMNFCNAVNDALHIALNTNKKYAPSPASWTGCICVRVKSNQFLSSVLNCY